MLVLLYLARLSVDFSSEGLGENVNLEERRQRQPQEFGGGGRKRRDVECCNVELDGKLAVIEPFGGTKAGAASGIIREVGVSRNAEAARS